MIADTLYTIKNYNKCKCCLDDTRLENLWEVHDHDGDQEVYGVMLTECFALPWEPTEESEYICELCVARLREAVHFKREILASEAVLDNALNINQQNTEDDNMSTIIKYEIIKKEGDNSEENDNEDVYQIEDNYEYQIEDNDENFEEIEYLELEDVNKDSIIDESSQGPSTPGFSGQGLSSLGNLSPDSEGPSRKRKRSKKNLRKYKRYTTDDLKEALDAVKSGAMDCASAAKKYGVPKKTMDAKIHREKGESKITNENQFKLIEEVRTLLLNTTAVPFKTKTTRYHCFFCTTDSPHYDDPDKLREHTRSKHSREYSKVEIYMRPHWIHEIIKLDVDDLHCNTCHILLPDWNYMFRHFSEVHNITFDQAFTRVIPYVLDSQLKCFLCQQDFHNFGKLDTHMNSHYNNYICYECGDTFLTVSRLDKHLNVHKVGSYPCPQCMKIFTLDKYRAKHISLVHNQENTVKCLYCREKFVGLFQRHLHVAEFHKEKLKTLTCEFCGKCFTWKAYFLAHVRRRHGTEKNHKCKFCDKSFLMNYELKNHLTVHTKEKKFLCPECGDSFTTKYSLKKHCKSHEYRV